MMKRPVLFPAIICGLLLVGGPASSQNAAPRAPYAPNFVPTLTEQGALYSQQLSDVRRLPEWFLGIYSGSTLSDYYSVASGLCGIMMATFNQHRIHCAALRSHGVQDNIHLMQGGQAQSILVPANTNFLDHDDFPPTLDIRFGFALVSHPGVMIVARHSGINSIADLPGKRINLGIEGSETHRLWSALLENAGLSMTQFKGLSNADGDDDLRALCAGEIDAYLSLVGRISPALIQTGERCGARVVSLEDDGTLALYDDQSGLQQETDSDVLSAPLKAPGSFDFAVYLLFHEQIPAYVTCHLAQIIYESPQLMLAEHLQVIDDDWQGTLEFDNVALHPGVELYAQDRACPDVRTMVRSPFAETFPGIDRPASSFGE